VSQQFLRLLVQSFPRLSYWITANFATFVPVCPRIPVCRARPSLPHSSQYTPHPSVSCFYETLHLDCSPLELEFVQRKSSFGIIKWEPFLAADTRDTFGYRGRNDANLYVQCSYRSLRPIDAVYLSSRPCLYLVAPARFRFQTYLGLFKAWGCCRCR
jgi:hypothetical protein